MMLLLGGDVMTGRGVDQILPHPGDPMLHEGYARDARQYVSLAEARHGRIPAPGDYAWPWGDALAVLAALAPDARLINLETSITRSADFALGKAVHYRMSPDNVGCLTVIRPDVCVLANNHVLDFGYRGLAETLDVLADNGLRAAGAGRDEQQARQLAIVPMPDGTRLIVLACGTRSSGIPGGWAATADRPGVDLLPDLSEESASATAARLAAVRRPGDVAVVSIHWGSNWGYHITADQRTFAHRLIDAGVDVVHGHSSHHARPIEIYRDRLILYGCGDLVDDYDGITGHESYRPDLRLLYFVALQPGSGRLARLRMLPLQARRLQLNRASASDTQWLHDMLDRASEAFGIRVDTDPEGMLIVSK